MVVSENYPDILRYVFQLSLTARDLLQKVAKDASLSYTEVASRINDAMDGGEGLLDAVTALAEEKGLDPLKYRINSVKIVEELIRILQEDYTQTLMISAVLGQMVEAEGKDRFPIPAFFAFLELLSQVPQAPSDTISETSTEIEERTTRVIELTTTLVSVIVEWSQEGVTGVAEDCPESLKELARLVFRKTKLFQSGLWTCISCGQIADVKTTRALMCRECDEKIRRDSPPTPSAERWERNRTGYGRTERKNQLE
ncbi:MAG: hypothetical protein ACE5H4_05815 [Candidatus Thorarchaeota archaeon]